MAVATVTANNILVSENVYSLGGQPPGIYYFYYCGGALVNVPYGGYSIFVVGYFAALGYLVYNAGATAPFADTGLIGSFPEEFGPRNLYVTAGAAAQGELCAHARVVHCGGNLSVQGPANPIIYPDAPPPAPYEYIYYTAPAPGNAYNPANYIENWAFPAVFSGTPGAEGSGYFQYTNSNDNPVGKLFYTPMLFANLSVAGVGPGFNNAGNATGASFQLKNVDLEDYSVIASLTSPQLTNVIGVWGEPNNQNNNDSFPTTIPAAQTQNGLTQTCDTFTSGYCNPSYNFTCTNPSGYALCSLALAINPCADINLVDSAPYNACVESNVGTPCGEIGALEYVFGFTPEINNVTINEGNGTVTFEILGNQLQTSSNIIVSVSMTGGSITGSNSTQNITCPRGSGNPPVTAPITFTATQDDLVFEVTITDAENSFTQVFNLPYNLTPILSVSTIPQVFFQSCTGGPGGGANIIQFNVTNSGNGAAVNPWSCVVTQVSGAPVDFSVYEAGLQCSPFSASSVDAAQGQGALAGGGGSVQLDFFLRSTVDTTNEVTLQMVLTANGINFPPYTFNVSVS